MIKTDFYFQNEFTIILLIPETVRARSWVKNNLQLEGWQRLGQNVPIEPRYFNDIAQGIINDGLIITSL